MTDMKTLILEQPTCITSAWIKSTRSLCNSKHSVSIGNHLDAWQWWNATLDYQTHCHHTIMIYHDLSWSIMIHNTTAWNEWPLATWWNSSRRGCVAKYINLACSMTIIDHPLLQSVRLQRQAHWPHLGIQLPDLAKPVEKLPGGLLDLISWFHSPVYSMLLCSRLLQNATLLWQPSASQQDCHAATCQNRSVQGIHGKQSRKIMQVLKIKTTKRVLNESTSKHHQNVRTTLLLGKVCQDTASWSKPWKSHHTRLLQRDVMWC